MKRALSTPLVVLFLGALAVFGACVPAVSFDVPLESETVVEGAGLLGQVLDTFPAFDTFTSFDLSTSKEFENNNAQKDQVQEARLTAFTLSVTDPEGGNLDFLDEISFFVEAPELPRERIATKAIPDGTTAIDLDLDDVDLAAYVRAETMTFTTDITGRRPSGDTTVKADVVIHIVAGP